MLKTLQNNPKISLAILIILMLGFSIDAIPVSIMEARNFITAREMITDGNWLLTTMNGEARYEKPPLPTWITAVFGLLFGIKNELALRFPAIIFIMIIGIFTYLLSNKLLNNKVNGFINGLIIITSFYVIGITFEAPWDIFTHGFMLMAIYYLFQIFNANHATIKHTLLAGIFLGCSILCKGPISIYVLLLPFLLAYGISFKYTLNKNKIGPLIGCLILGLIIGGSWYLYIRIHDVETFTAIAKKETGNWTSYNIKPFYYYWSFFTQSGIWTIPAFISLLYPYLKHRVSNLKAYRFSFLWTVFAVILLTVIPEKKSRYLMPVLIPLAINTGFYIEYLIRHFKTLKNIKETSPVYFNFGLIAFIAIGFPVIGYLFFGEKLSGQWLSFSLVSIASLILGISILINLRKKQIQSVFFLTVLFYASLLSLGLPLAKAIPNENYKPLFNLQAEAEKQRIQVYSLNHIAPEMIWQLGSKIDFIKTENVTFNFPKGVRFGMLVHSLTVEDEKQLKKYYTMEQKTTFDLNIVKPESRKYKDRLVNHYYILTRIKH